MVVEEEKEMVRWKRREGKGILWRIQCEECSSQSRCHIHGDSI